MIEFLLAACYATAFIALKKWYTNPKFIEDGLMVRNIAVTITFLIAPIWVPIGWVTHLVNWCSK